MEMPVDGVTRPCERKDCGGTLTFRIKTPIPGTGGGRVDTRTNRGPFTEPDVTPGWTCSRCNYFKAAYYRPPQTDLLPNPLRAYER